MPSRSIRSSSVVVIAALLLGAAPVGAQDRDKTRKAREHYRRGEEAFKAERYEEAFREFEAGFALVPRALFVLNMAHSERKRGELRSAIALYRKFLVMEPESKLRPEVESVVSELEAAIGAEDAARASKQPAPDLTPRAVEPAPRPPAAVVGGPPPPPPPAPTRWWVWATVGGAVVVGAGLAAFLLLADDEPAKQGTLGTLK